MGTSNIAAGEPPVSTGGELALLADGSAEDAFRDLLKGRMRQSPPGDNPIIIEATVTRSTMSPPPDMGASSQPPPQASAKRGASRFAIVAGAVFGIGMGFSGGVLLTRWAADVDELNSRAADLRGRLTKIENEGFGAKLAGLREDIEKLLSARDQRMARLDDRVERVERDANARLDDVAGRVDTMTNALIARDATASIPARGQGVTMLARRKSTPGGWVLRDVRDGVALVESPTGTREVALGDVLPGAGRVRRIEKRGGVWSLYTAAGVIDQDPN